MIYVDELQERMVYGHHKWCHLLADSIEELHKFAITIGLRSEWYQEGSCPHYDITESKRARAVRLGAKEIKGRSFLKVVRKWHGWKKKEGEEYYYINFDMYVSGKICLKVEWDEWFGTDKDESRYNDNNCFKTKKEAERKRKQVLKVLKGR